MFIQLMACLAGAASGLFAWWIATVVPKRLGDDGFWQQLSVVSGTLLHRDEEDRFFQEYLRLLPMLFKYTLKKLSTLAIAFSPAFVLFASLTSLDNWMSGTREVYVAAASPESLAIDLSGRIEYLNEKNNTLSALQVQDTPATLAIGNTRFHCDKFTRKQAMTTNWMKQLLLVSLGFEILHAPPPSPAVAFPLVLVRPSHGDKNLLWPYLSDWEFGFFVLVSLAPGAVVLVKKFKAC